jgi:hypothetical protein
MKRDLKNTDNSNNKLFNHLAADKKKTVLALCLILLMVLMWIRIFAKKSPVAAQAASVAKEVEVKEQESSPIIISYIELPRIQGRNDVITRSFFDPNGWSGFIPDGKYLADGQQPGVIQNLANLRSRLINAGLKLEAIELGGNPRVFINGRLLSIGDKFILRDGANTYECEVVKIEENLVFINYGGVEIELKLVPEG